MTLSRNQLFGIIVVFVLVLGVIAAWQITGDDGGEEAKDPIEESCLNIFGLQLRYIPYME